MDLGGRMKELRSEKKILQKELAAVLKVSIGTVCNYENNVHFPDGDTLCKIAEYFDVSVDYLLKRTDYRSSLKELNREICPGYPISKLVNKIVSLDSQGQNEARQYIEYLEYIRTKE